MTKYCWYEMRNDSAIRCYYCYKVLICLWIEIALKQINWNSFSLFLYRTLFFFSSSLQVRRSLLLLLSFPSDPRSLFLFFSSSFIFFLFSFSLHKIVKQWHITLPAWMCCNVISGNMQSQMIFLFIFITNFRCCILLHFFIYFFQLCDKKVLWWYLVFYWNIQIEPL